MAGSVNETDFETFVRPRIALERLSLLDKSTAVEAILHRIAITKIYAVAEKIVTRTRKGIKEEHFSAIHPDLFQNSDANHQSSLLWITGDLFAHIRRREDVTGYNDDDEYR